ncbi:MAG: thioredoxin family protein [Rhodobacteraceae bacterium]|nr:thioredoxin family protein [Paracoccaceae bacterium]
MIRESACAIFLAAVMAVGPTLGFADSAPPANPTATATAADPAPATQSRFRLLMIEQAGCVYCRMWNHDLGPIYPKTPEGQIAPLERTDLHHPMPEGVTLTGGKAIYTPTFVLLDNGTEIARIEGYASEDFFWGLLGQALQQAGADLPPTAQ